METTKQTCDLCSREFVPGREWVLYLGELICDDCKRYVMERNGYDYCVSCRKIYLSKILENGLCWVCRPRGWEEAEILADIENLHRQTHGSLAQSLFLIACMLLLIVLFVMEVFG